MGNNNDKKKLSKEQKEYIINQGKKSIFKIKSNRDSNGIGFLCTIPFPKRFNLFTVFITNNHILNKNDISFGKKIIISNDNIKKSILIDNSRKTYTNEMFDVTIIEIKKSDNINNNLFLDIDFEFYESNQREKYDNAYIYMLRDNLGSKKRYSLGLLKSISSENFNIIFKKSKQVKIFGPILNIMNYKVIGIYRKNWDGGTFIKIITKDFIKYFNDNKKKNKESDLLEQFIIIESKEEKKIKGNKKKNEQIKLNLNNKSKIQYKDNFKNKQELNSLNAIFENDNNKLGNYNGQGKNNIKLMGDKSMKIFCRTLTGKIIDLDVSPDDTIEEAKLQIKEKEGIPSNQQRMIFSRILLDDDKTFEYYKIKRENTIQLVLRLRGTFMIYCKLLSGKTIKLDVNGKDSIEKVKRKIQNKEGIQPNEQRLCFEGKELEMYRTISDYDIPNTAILDLIFCLRR